MTLALHPWLLLGALGVIFVLALWKGLRANHRTHLERKLLIEILRGTENYELHLAMLSKLEEIDHVQHLFRNMRGERYRDFFRPPFFIEHSEEAQAE